MAETMTVLVHGTFSQDDPWVLPSNANSLHNFLKSTVFPKDFMINADKDVFKWSGGASIAHRSEAIDCLEQYCLNWQKKKGFGSVRLVGHSHGATVVNGVVSRLAARGINVKTLIDLAIPIRFSDTQGLVPRCNLLKPCYPQEHKPDLTKVDGNRVFVFRPKTDLIVTQIAYAKQDFRGTSINGRQVVRIRNKLVPGVLPHWFPTSTKCWISEGWDKISFEVTGFQQSKKRRKPRRA